MSMYEDYEQQSTSALEVVFDNLSSLFEMIGGLLFFYAILFIKEFVADWLESRKNHNDRS